VKRPVDKAGLKCLQNVIERESVKNRNGGFQAFCGTFRNHLK